MLKESMWGYAIIVLGILAVGIIWFFANTTRTDQHNFNLLKETTEAALIDSLDLAAYRLDGTIRIEEEKFVENLIRRFAENADLSNTYVIEIFDVNTEPPKVRLRVSSKKDTTATGEIVEFDMVNNLDAILETKYYAEEKEEIEEESSNQSNLNRCISRSTDYTTKPACSCSPSRRTCNCQFSINLQHNGEIKGVTLQLRETYYSRYLKISNVTFDAKNKFMKYSVTATSASYLTVARRQMRYAIKYTYCF